MLIIGKISTRCGTSTICKSQIFGSTGESWLNSTKSTAMSTYAGYCTPFDSGIITQDFLAVHQERDVALVCIVHWLGCPAVFPPVAKKTKTKSGSSPLPRALQRNHPSLWFTLGALKRYTAALFGAPFPRYAHVQEACSCSPYLCPELLDFYTSLALSRPTPTPPC
jgi:hypothetical protein